MTTDEPRDTVPSSEFLLWRDDPAYPDPTPEDLKRPEFEAVWRAIRGWDIGREPPPGRQRLYAGATGNEVMHILNAVPSMVGAEQVRENIHAYLQHVANVEVGSILTRRGREVVGFCAAWVRNRLDEKWLADKVVPFPLPKELAPPLEAPPSETTALEAVRQIIAEWEGTTVAQTASCQAEHAARHLDRIRTLVRGGSQ